MRLRSRWITAAKKAAIVVMDAVRQEFGADAVIAPAAVAANGERVESVKRLSPEQLAKVKQQIAMAKAGLAASSLGAGLGMHSGSEPKLRSRLLRERRRCGWQPPSLWRNAGRHFEQARFG